MSLPEAGDDGDGLTISDLLAAVHRPVSLGCALLQRGLWEDSSLLAGLLMAMVGSFSLNCLSLWIILTKHENC